ncbi:MAG: hypothetical protein ACXAEN_16695 [Candidatus Thorarchaeota archaeon]|jgi:hypothetical protein
MAMAPKSLPGKSLFGRILRAGLAMDSENLITEFLLSLGYVDVSDITDPEKRRSYVGRKRFYMTNSMFTTGNFSVVTEWGLRYEMSCDWRSGPYFFLTNKNPEYQNWRSVSFNLYEPDSLEKLKLLLEAKDVTWYGEK